MRCVMYNLLFLFEGTSMLPKSILLWGRLLYSGSITFTTTMITINAKTLQKLKMLLKKIKNLKGEKLPNKHNISLPGFS